MDGEGEVNSKDDNGLSKDEAAPANIVVQGVSR